MTRRRKLLAVTLFVLTPAAASAADEKASIEFFYPLVTRRPVIERELELRFTHDKSRDGRRSEAAAAVELPVLPRWQVELEVPVVFTDPREGPSAGGPGDVEVQNKLLLLKSVEHKALVAAGLDAKLPSGSERRGLGGEAAVAPFLAAGIALGDFDLLSDLAYEWNVNTHVKGEREQVLAAGVAVGYRAARRFTPLVELTTLTQTRGGESDERSLRGKTQVSVVPGFNVRLSPGTTARFGIQLPLTNARKADSTLRGGLVWEF
jgi:outer membrane putative beta-barrel porin/alpha-amylase